MAGTMTSFFSGFRLIFLMKESEFFYSDLVKFKFILFYF